MVTLQDALVAVLKANHLSTARGVAKKAQAIMRQVHANGCGSLTLDEFIVMAKKFPNLVSRYRISSSWLWRASYLPQVDEPPALFFITSQKGERIFSEIICMY